MTKKSKNLELFGNYLREKRIEHRIGLREICRKVNFDPGNWSKIERGKLPPPNNRDILSLWAANLKIKKNSTEFNSFIDMAFIAQGIIPKVLSEKEMMDLLPAFFRTIRNEKPTKEELDNLVELIKETN